MYVAAVDSEVLRSDEMLELKKAYREKFEKRFMPFNYADFDRIGERCAAQVYMDIIKQCLEENKPYEVESKWCGPNSLFGH